MKVLPVVFCFDENMVIPAGVCISSLLENAKPTTFYDIFILVTDSSKTAIEESLKVLNEKYVNFSIKYRAITYNFDNAFEIRGITKAAYYRLLIPELVPEYDKIMYHDVDIIFREDLTEIFDATDLTNYYIGGVISTGFLHKHTYEERIKLGLDPNKYILSGNLIFNSGLLRKDKIVDIFKKEADTSKYKYQDQDIINIVCKGKIRHISPRYCCTYDMFRISAHNVPQEIFSEKEIFDAQKFGIVHYNGPKPWKSICPNFDIWWEYYRKSVFFDEKFYYDFFHNKVNELDHLPLLKRIKILLRYFIK